MEHLLTSKEGIALDIIFGMLGKSRFNREIDDWGSHYKYFYVASRAPKLQAMHADVNKILRLIADAGSVPFEICYFKLGDRYYWYEKFPTALSDRSHRARRYPRAIFEWLESANPPDGVSRVQTGSRRNRTRFSAMRSPMQIDCPLSPPWAFFGGSLAVLLMAIEPATLHVYAC